jgi:hypothetical protein
MTYTRNHDGTPVPVDSTTIHRSLSEYPEAGFYGVGHLSVPGAPTDLLTDAAYGSPDYAGTHLTFTLLPPSWMPVMRPETLLLPPQQPTA